MSLYHKINGYSISIETKNLKTQSCLTEIFNFRSRKITTIVEMANRVGEAYNLDGVSYSGTSVQIMNFSDLDDDREIMAAANELKEQGGNPGELEKASHNRFKPQHKNRSPKSLS